MNKIVFKNCKIISIDNNCNYRTGSRIKSRTGKSRRKRRTNKYYI